MLGRRGAAAWAGWWSALALVLAGCAGPAMDAAKPEVPGAVPTALEDDVVRWGYRAAGAASTETWLNGTFQGPGGCGAARCPYNTFVDLHDEVPVGVPARIELTLEYSTDIPSFTGPLDLRLLGPASFVYAHSHEQVRPGLVQASWLVLRDPETVEVEVSRNDFGLGPWTYSFSLRIHVASDPHVVEPGVPTELSLSNGNVLAVRPVDAGPLHGVLYGPDDAVAHRFDGVTGNVTLRADDLLGAGSYVLYVAGPASTPATVAVNTPDPPPLRPLTFSEQQGPSRDVVGQASVTWTFDLDSAPLSVGIGYVDMRPVSTTGTAGHARLDSPVATVLDEVFRRCATTCVYTSYPHQSAYADAAHPDLEPGTYTAVYTPRSPENGSVWHLIVRYDR